MAEQSSALATASGRLNIPTTSQPGTFTFTYPSSTLAPSSVSSISSPPTTSTSRPHSYTYTSPFTYTGPHHRNLTATTSTASSTGSLSPLYTEDATYGNSDSDSDRSSIYNYYYIFIALFLIAVVAGLYFVRRRRHAKRAGRRHLRQTALARDLDGWSGPRRWLYGNWRTDHVAQLRREEGLDESGNAPPPYQPGAVGSAGRGDLHAPVAIPLRTFSRTHLGTKPPDYVPTIIEVHSEDELETPRQ